MISIEIPYLNETMILNVDKHRLSAILRPKKMVIKQCNPESIVLDSLELPIDSDKLCNIAKDKKSCLIVTSDHTRAMPSRITLPILLKEVRRYNPDISVTILIATGLHRPTTNKEMCAMFGEHITCHEKIVVHDASNQKEMRDICVLPSGTVFTANKLLLENDVVVTEGLIEPHLFAGYSGGRKSILPGIASAQTIRENHCATAIRNQNAKAGVLEGNVVHEDMLSAVKKVPISFCLNIVMNEDRAIAGAFSGDIISAHNRGCRFLASYAAVGRVKADIVVSSNGGYPLDQNLYQCAKGLSTAARCVKERGVIIFVASCFDGIGGNEFSRLMQSGTPQEISTLINQTPREDTVSEQWCAQIIAEILININVILVTRHMDHGLVAKLHMIPANSVNEALSLAYKIKGYNASVVVIPDGVGVIIK